MAIDLSEDGRGYFDLKKHIGHKIAVVPYGNGTNISIECEDCGEVLVDFNEPWSRWMRRVCRECGMEIYRREDTGEMSCSNDSCENATADWGNIGEPS